MERMFCGPSFYQIEISATRSVSNRRNGSYKNSYYEQYIQLR